MRKKDRQRLIQKMIREVPVGKQEELVALLQERGVDVTQATVSRDIKEMKLVKVPIGFHEYRYSMPSEKQDFSQRLEKLFRSSFVELKQMEKFVSIRTTPGSGFALGGLIEQVFPEKIFVVMTNDDKVLIISMSEADAAALKQLLLDLV
ncbi:arginine repressor [Vagococcus acidifermentans]|uniref:Arginine repressor n=1 Tax=Vagococcus acidifermentans TaxID=564710 RepID=A0A430AWQ3_9ENTE|nr:ArgR family transcriptional regulator [Vagococcus acidifermentans]RSU12466.1 hypothetical protein CBF27_05685 [Vagococcus acidifermentans]